MYINFSHLIKTKWSEAERISNPDDILIICACLYALHEAVEELYSIVLVYLIL